MHALWPFLLYGTSVVVVPAVLGYPLLVALQWAGIEVDFVELVYRFMNVMALLALWPLLRALGLRSAAAWGYPGPAGRFAKELVLGLGIGVVTLLVHVGVLLALEVRVIDPGFGPGAADLVVLLLESLAAGCLVGVIEETWFRGALHSALERRAGAANAIAITAVLYAAVHFIEPDVRVESAGWLSAVAVIGHAFGEVESIDVVGSFLALVAAGTLLGLIRRHTVGIGRCIGVHAGWVLVIKVFREASDVDPRASLNVLVGDFDGVIGYLAFFWLAVLSGAYYWRYVSAPARR